jgi:hypothetical protein
MHRWSVLSYTVYRLRIIQICLCKTNYQITDRRNISDLIRFSNKPLAMGNFESLMITSTVVYELVV